MLGGAPEAHEVLSKTPRGQLVCLDIFVNKPATQAMLRLTSPLLGCLLEPMRLLT